jgi:very-short-patch-repair endonuclease
VPRLRWAIEIDIHPTHEETIGRLNDRRRDLAAASIGWCVTRVRRDDYFTAFDRAVADVLSTYRRRDAQFGAATATRDRNGERTA